LFTNDGHFYILALSQNRVRLLEGWRDEVRELELADVPTSLAEALRWDERENQVRWHTVGGPTTGGQRRPAIFHGQGGAADDANVKEDILRFFQKVDEGLENYLKGERIPLVLAGVEYLHPIYREANHYPYLADKGITGNADDTRAEELHARAWEIVSPRFRQAQEDAAALYRQQAGMGGRASQDLAEVVPAAYYGRAGTLFVREGARRWGLFDPQTGQVTFHDSDQPTPDDTDLLDFAAAYTYLNNGEVYVVRKAEMPADSDCAAVLRY
jgi:hypothetical protein